MLTSFQRMLLSKAADDQGFQLAGGELEGGLVFGSGLTSLRLWLSAVGDGLWVVGVSDGVVGRALGSPVVVVSLPEGFVGAVGASGIVELYPLKCFSDLV